MKKQMLVLASTLTFALSATACSGKPAVVQTTPTAVLDAAPAPSEAQAEETSASEESDADSLTGTVDENKGFMITIISDDDSETYVFPLDEDQSDAYSDIKAGDKVTVSYTNGLPSPDNLATVVTDIKTAG